MRLAFLLALAVATLLFARERYAPPDPAPESAPAADFSATRARATLARVLGDGAPHPVGSDAGAAVRGRIVAELEALGYAPRLQRGFACGRHGACAFVVNVIAELPGATRDAVLVSSHYDSVPASGGANDDGTGVAATLEIARALKGLPTPTRSVLLLFDEGEEEGLLGARAFADADPDFARVRAAANLDARGSHGPATIFEVSPGNAGVIDLIAARVPRPVTSSLFFTIYERMPNDTDFSVWRAHARGANFAFLSRIEHYHTARDRLENTSPATMQQEGDGALAMTRALAEADLAPTGNAVWFDVLALFVVRWGAAWTRPLAILALGLVGLAVTRRVRARRASIGEVGRGLGAIPVAVIGASILATTMTSALEASGALPAPWTANAPLAMAAASLVGLALAMTAAAALARAGAEGAWCGVWTVTALLGTVVAFALPGASYLLVVPALFAGIAGLVADRFDTERARFVAGAIPALALLVLFSPAVLLLYDAMGVLAAPIGAATAALLGVAFAPALALLPPNARWLPPGGLIVAALVTAIVAARSAPFDERVPSRANVIVAEDEHGARVMIDPSWGGRPWGPVPPPMRAALGAARSSPRFEWSADLVDTADLPSTGASAPELVHVSDATEGSERRVTLRARSVRGARTLGVLLPPGADARFTRANDQTLPPIAPSAGGWRALVISGVPEDGVALEIVARHDPIALTLYDETPGVPASASRVVTARPSNATTTQRGDVTIISRHTPL